MRRYVQLRPPRNGAPVFEQGRSNGLQTTTDGAVAGRLLPGSPGIIEISLPAAAAPSGSILRAPVVIAAEANAVKATWFERAPGGNEAGDPDASPAGADWRVGECVSASQSETSPPPSPGSNAPGTPVTTTESAGATSGSGAGAASGAKITSLAFRRARVTATYGHTTLVRGAVAPATAGVPVDIVNERGKILVTLHSAADGGFAVNVRTLRPARLRAQAAGLTSAPIHLRMAPLVRASFMATEHGATYSGTVTPFLNGSVAIERHVDGQWLAVGYGRLTDGRFRLRVPGAARGRHRVVIEAGRRTDDRPHQEEAVKRRIIVALCGLLVLPAAAAAHGPPAISAGPTGLVKERTAEFAFTYHEPAPLPSFRVPARRRRLGGVRRDGQRGTGRR